MTELQQALALESAIEFEGVSYQMGGTTIEVMAAWEDWLASEALERLLRIYKRPNAESACLDAVAKQAAAGVFDFFGEVSRTRMSEMSGLKQLVYLRIKQNHPTVIRKTIDAIVERDWEILYREHLKEGAAMEASSPNAEAPAGANQNP